ncbi:bifunctional glycosyltransferase/CDP-glycerol:glycerophosphate glycerophosphotransferase [Helicobacter mesocricetorum]|uniref:bifunctional glycosyltransferase/CDP-glycerol:glycerophosphate glycerophosphotransferase n=1 Tax=Helicobacter mesocricetorum TaxID=87012 RepID=UPI000CF01C7F|nr:CDP-glycerol glycerophosphotransferase family protein [Helicobacter mesocricetorum]
MKFSIIIPAYNAQRTIADTINSIIKQKITPQYTYEILVVNDDSTDDTLLVCESFFYLYPNLNLQIFTQENAGLTASRNKGLENSNGDIVIFVDADDLLPLDALWHYYLAFSSHKLDFAAGLMGYYWQHNKSTSVEKNYLKGYKGLIEDKSLFVPIFANAVSACTKAYKKEFLVQYDLWFLEGKHLCEDHFWTLQLLKHAQAIFLIDEVVLYYQMHPNNSVGNWKNNYLEDMIAVQENILKLQIPLDLDTYYERFLKNFDFKKRIVEQAIIGQESAKLQEIIKPLQRLLEIIPIQYQQKYMPKWYAFKDHSQSGIYQEMLRIRRNRKIKRFYKKAFIKPLTGLVNTANGLWYRKLIHKYQCRHKLLKFLYKSFSLLPIKKQKITLAECIYGMKYLGPIKEILLEDSRLFVKTLNYRITLSDDIKRMYHFAKSQIILIDNYYQPLFNITPRKETLVMQCWHAGGLFKKFGCDSVIKGSKTYEYETKIHKSYSYAFVSGQKTIKGYMSAFNLKEEQIIPIGNIMADKVIKNQKSQKEAKILLGINPNKKLIVYAPTFRDWERNSFKLRLDFQPLVEKYGETYEFALRIHPTTNFAIEQPNIYNFSSKEEWLVLNAADALIADYSSIIFAYSYFGRPIYFYPYDYQMYLGQKGFYEDYLNFVPGDIAFTQEKLLDLLEDIPQVSPRVQQLWRDYMGECDGNTAHKIVDFIKEKISL